MLFSFWTIFNPFTPLTAKKYQKYEKAPGDIIILQECAKNHDHMLHCSWDMVRDGCYCCFSSWAIFWRFTPLTAQKIKISKKRKKKSTWRYHNFTQLHKKSWLYAILFLRYGAWQIWLLFFILGTFLPFYSPNSQKSENIKKMKKAPADIIIFHKCIKNHNCMLYCSWDMARDGYNSCFSFWAIFCPFSALTAQK